MKDENDEEIEKRLKEESMARARRNAAIHYIINMICQSEGGENALDQLGSCLVPDPFGEDKECSCAWEHHSMTNELEPICHNSGDAWYRILQSLKPANISSMIKVHKTAQSAIGSLFMDLINHMDSCSEYLGDDSYSTEFEFIYKEIGLKDTSIIIDCKRCFERIAELASKKDSEEE